ncbi:MAG: polymer-forming cytoskeletal protein [Candidatus Binatia bacterium]
MSIREGREDPPFFQPSPRTVLFPESDVSGKLSFDLPVKIDSRFSGEVKTSELLVLGPNAEVKAKISARHLQVEGSLVGEVHVSGWMEILPGGRFQGEIEAGQLKIHPGAVFEGKGNVVNGR